MFHLTRVSTVLVFAVVLVGASALAQQRLRVAEDAREIRAFRLSEKSLSGLRQVAKTLAREYTPQPERPRADGAMFAVLSLSLSFGEPYRDATVTHTVRVIESGHADLNAAIAAAGLTPREYVLTQITLLLTVPVVASEQAGGKPVTSDVAPANLEFVRAHWTEVESIVEDLGAASGRPKP